MPAPAWLKTSPACATLVFQYRATEYVVPAVMVIAIAKPFPSIDVSHQIFLIMGCAVIVGCFFIGQSINYRGVMLLLALPGLLAMTRHSRLARFTSVTILFLMWDGFFRHLIGSEYAPVPYWIVRELAWWGIVAVLFAILIDFAAKCPIFDPIERASRMAP